MDENATEEMTQFEGGEPGAGKTLRVLVVEDDAAAREACCRYLEFHGYAVDAAADADEAEAIAAERPPDVAICDWRLNSDRDGVDVARSLQSAHGSYVVFVTANSLDDLRDLTRDMPVAHYLSKPLSLKLLKDVLVAAERQRAAER